MNLNGTFGSWLRQRRKALDLTQADLADQVGCSIIMIRKIEADERRPSKQISERMADVLAIAQENRAAFLSFARRMTKPQSHLLEDLIPTVNLPAQTTPFIGRDAELAQIADRLADSACRLLTLVGPGGIGKTRLALQAASECIEKFVDGVFFVSLTPIGTTTLISTAVANALQLSFYSQETPDTQLINYLRSKHVLLVLDNYEHLLGGIGLLADLMVNAPHVKLLVTSRERLNIREEWALPVAGLPFPAHEANGSTGSYDSVELFMQTAHRVESGFTLIGHETAVMDICRTVEGMPLGIELAATWLRTMPCDQIAEQIRRDLDFLATPLRNVEARHRSLRVVFEHSWDLLSEAERDVVMKLSVFRGGCDLESAEQVATASLWLVAGLVDKSLVRLNPVGRYEMHELLRQFAADKLAKAGQTEQTRHQHLQYFLSLAERLEQKLFGSDHLAVLDQLETEHDNCRVALDWAWQAGEMEAGLRLANALGWFWSLRTHWVEGDKWLEQFRKANINASVQQQAKALLLQLELVANSGDNERVAALGAEALACANDVEDPSLRGWLLMTAAFWAYYPTTYYEEALALFRDTGDLAGMCRALCFASQRALQLGDFSLADELQEEGIQLARQTGNKSGLADLLMFSACNRWYQRKIDLETVNLYQESLALHRELRNKGDIMVVLHCLGSVACLQRDIEQASTLFLTSLRMAQEIGSKGYVLRILISLASVFCEHTEPERGARILGAIGETVLSQYFSPGFFAQEAIEDYERGLSAARSQLGETGFAAAFAEGKRMSLEQAIAYAL